MNSKLKDVLIRAGKTFWQAALASLAVAIPEIIELIPSGWKAMIPVLVSTGVGALAAGLSAVYNGVIAPILEKKKVQAVEKGGDPSIDEGK